MFHHRHAMPCPFVRRSDQFDNSQLKCSTFKMLLINTYALSYSTFGEIVWHSLHLFLCHFFFFFRNSRTSSSYVQICRYNVAVASLQYNFIWNASEKLTEKVTKSIMLNNEIKRKEQGLQINWAICRFVCAWKREKKNLTMKLSSNKRFLPVIGIMWIAATVPIWQTRLIFDSIYSFIRFFLSLIFHSLSITISVNILDLISVAFYSQEISASSFVR